ncbi:hypothetical protein TNCV_2890291 [Trichonephila clavipes]|nr:hypothetical protein TNCV_2890291 [Trichonephila clavipes]
MRESRLNQDHRNHSKTTPIRTKGRTSKALLRFEIVFGGNYLSGQSITTTCTARKSPLSQIRTLPFHPNTLGSIRDNNFPADIYDRVHLRLQCEQRLTECAP